MRKFAAILICLAMVFTLTACGMTNIFHPVVPSLIPAPSEDVDIPEPTEEPPEPTPGETVYDDSLIYEVESEEGEFDDEWENHWEYSYHLPAVSGDSASVKALNRDIADFIYPSIEESMIDIEQKTGIGLCSVNWKSAWNGEILTLMVIAEWDWSYTDYKIFHFDFAQDRQLTTTEMLYVLGVDAEEFIDRARYTAESFFDENNYYYMTEWLGDGLYDMFYAATRNETLCARNINYDLMIFPADELYVMLPIGSMAGAGRYNHLLPLREIPDTKKLHAERGIYSADYSDGEVTVMVGTPSGDGFIPPRLIPGTYTVNGAYSIYTDLFIGTIYDRVYLFMITERGEIECVDIIAGVTGGCLATMQLQGMGGIVRLYDDVNQAGESVVLASDGEDRVYDLTGYVLDGRESLDYQLEGEWCCEYYMTEAKKGETACFRYFYIDPDCNFALYDINDVTHEEQRKAGVLAFCGFAGEGAVYSYSIYNPMAITGVISADIVLGDLTVRTYSDDDPFSPDGNLYSSYVRTYG